MQVFLQLFAPPPICSARRYSFATPSTLKPTQWHYPSGSINQIPGTATVCGDMRVTPFYDIEQVMRQGRVGGPSPRHVLCEPHTQTG